MAGYDLNQGASESFTFILGGHEYQFAYPNTEDIAEAQKLKDDNDKMMDWIYQFVTPGEGSPPIKEAMAKANIKVLKNFNTMLRTEFSIGD